MLHVSVALASEHEEMEMAHRRLPLSPYACRTLNLSAVILLALGGCSPAPVQNFTESEAVADLPVRQQAELRGYLRMFFGTPSRPRLMTPTGEIPELPDEEDEDESNDEGNSKDGNEGSPKDSQPVNAIDVEQIPGMVDIPRTALIPQAELEEGHRVYMRQCVHCHGVTGDGQGPAAKYLNPLPRDYRAGKFKFISSARGAKPLRSDLVRIIRYGAKGTSMPSFRFLPEAEVDAVIDYVVMLSQRGEVEQNLVYLAENELSEDEDFDPELVVESLEIVQDSWEEARETLVLPATPMTPYSDESALEGRRAFLTRGCAKCHGADGRGRTQANVGKDDWGNEVKAADLTAGMLHGGRRPIDIYRRIWAGINGTPMPAFANALSESPETAWDLVHYMESLVAGKQIRLSEEEEAELLQPPAATSEESEAAEETE